MSVRPLLLAALLPSCAVVNVHTAGTDDVKVERHLGFIAVTTRPLSGAVMVEAHSLGLLRTDQGVVLGYRDEVIAAVPENSCRVIFWVKNEETAREVARLLPKKSDELCVINTSKGG